MEIIIENITASFRLGQKVDLKRCANKLAEYIRYDPKSFPGLLYRRRKNLPIIILFGSGKAVCTGARSEKSLKHTVKKFVKILSEKKLLLMPYVDVKIQVENIIASVKLNKKLDLEVLATVLNNINFEDNSYLIHKIPSLGVRFLIFESGNMICVGKNSERKTRTAIKQLLKLVEELETLGLS